MSKPKPRITGETRTVPIDSIEGNPWNPNVQSDFKYEHTKKVIAEFGFLDPVTVRSGRLKGKAFKKPQIIDGEHRWRAAKEIGLTEVLILDVGRMADEKAKVLTDVMNNLRGENDPLRWAEMVQSVKDTMPDLVQYLPYQPDELDAMIQSTQVDWGAFDGSMNPDGPRDEAGELYKKFSVSMSKASMARTQDLMRKVKAAHGIDDDAQAFEIILDGYEAHVASQGAHKAPAPEPEAQAPRSRRRATKRRTKPRKAA